MCRGWVLSSWIFIIYFMLSDIVWISLPVFILKILICLSLRIIARKLPWGLRLRDSGALLAWRSWRKWVWVLYLYERWVGKSKVFGSQISRNALSSIERQIPRCQFILMNLIGCLWKDTVDTTKEFSSFLSSSIFSSTSLPIIYSSSSILLLFWSIYVSIIHIFPVFYSLTATNYQFLPYWGMKSQLLGTKFSLTDVFKSQLRTSNIFRVLSRPILQRRSWFLERDAPVIRPLWALKFLANSTRWNTFLQNLICPSTLKVMINSDFEEAITLFIVYLCIRLSS